MPACSAEPAVSVLFIGNSYTFFNDMPEMVREIADGSSIDVEVEMIAPGGWWLRDHAASQETLDRIARGGWDYVVLQEQSQITAVRDLSVIETWPAATTLANAAHRGGAEVVVFMTWGHELGSDEVGHATYESMQTAVGQTYLALAESLSVDVVPVGAAWWLARESGKAVLYQPDGSHPSKEGSYLAAVVFVGRLLGVTLSEIDETLGLDDETARSLRQAADEALAGTIPWSG